jgi:DNA-binding NarL/FixJ family response regulator
MALIIPIKAAIAAWHDRFDEAHRLLAPVLERIVDPADKAYWSSVCALSFAVDGKRDRASSTVRLALEFSDIDSPFAYTRRYANLARALCAAAEALAGRTTNANRILSNVGEDSSPVVSTLRDAVTWLIRAVKNPGLKDDVLERLYALDALGYAGVRKIVSTAVESSISAENPADGLLTRAEIAVLESLAEGRGPKDIALETGRSVYTIQVHIKNIIKKLGCSGRNEALTVARKRGLLA